MSTPPTKLQRWLDLVAYLAGRHFPVPVEDLRDNIPAYAVDPDASEREKETIRRMFERDKDELRELGIPIDTVDYSINYGHEQKKGYRLARKDFHLPYLKLVTEASEGGPQEQQVSYRSRWPIGGTAASREIPQEWPTTS